MVKFLVQLIPITGLMAAWNAPNFDTWGFWIGALCIGLIGAIDTNWKT